MNRTRLLRATVSVPAVVLLLGNLWACLHGGGALNLAVAALLCYALWATWWRKKEEGL